MVNYFCVEVWIFIIFGCFIMWIFLWYCIVKREVKVKVLEVVEVVKRFVEKRENDRK